MSRRIGNEPQDFYLAAHEVESKASPSFGSKELTDPHRGRKTEGYTGADIKEVVQLGLKLAFHAGAELTNDHLLATSSRRRPCRP